MAGLSRDLFLQKSGVTVAALRSKSFNIDFSTVDVTTDDSNGYQTLLAESGKVSCGMDFAGVLNDESLMNTILSNGAMQQYDDFSLVWASGASIAATFNLTNFSINGGGSDAEVDFSGSLQSSGAYTFVAAT